VDSDLWPGALLLVAGVIAFVALVAAEAGVIAGVRERASREAAESRGDAIRRFYHERQLTLSSLALARNLSLVGVTCIIVFLVIRQWEDSWLALTATALATAAAFMLLQALPRLVVARDPARWQRLLRPIVDFVRVTFRVPVLLLDTPMAILQRRWRRDETESGAEVEEAILLTEMDEAGAALEEGERQIIRGVVEMEFTTIREVMIPRTDIIAAELSEGFEKVAAIMVDRGFSRVPVYERDLDHVVGIAYGKQVLKHLSRNGDRVALTDVIRPAHFVPESKKVHEMLAEMRQKQISIAIVVDEYGGTAGLVTIEDLLEELVGDIRDEFDVDEQHVQLITANEGILDARVGIDELNEMFGVAIQKDDFDSIGGLISNELGRIPSAGDHVQVNGISFKVLSVAGRRIKKVRVKKTEHKAGEAQQNGG